MTRTGRVPAERDPVARLMVDVPLAHLDRPFDYLVPSDLSDDVRAGSRVRVRFAGRLVDGFVLERRAASEHDGNLAWVERAVGEPVLTPETTALFRAVADRWAGSFVDVVRLGVPSRHAAAEASEHPAVPLPKPPETPLARYRAGPAFVSAVAAGKPARAVWSALPGEDWPARLAEVVQAALAAGRGAVVVVPDARDLVRLDAALGAVLPKGSHVVLSAESGPSTRYKRWLAVRRGSVKVAIGNRAAAFAPVADLGLLAIWDDGDDLHAEPRAPYPNARDVLSLRSSLTGAALLVGGFGRTAEAQLLVETGWAHEITAERDVLRAAMPRVAAVDDFTQRRDPAGATSRLPGIAFEAAREALEAGRPVLVQVPRRGYAPSLACVRDRVPARCRHCSGPLALASGQAIASCRWCGRLAGDWSCPKCGGGAFRAVVVGSARTAEELGRAFPGVPVRTSGGDHVLGDVPAGPALVVATPGAEPSAPDGYGAALLLDGWALLSRPDLRAAEESVRRWLNAAALVRADGRVVVGAEAAIPAVQSIVRWDPAGYAARELAERRELGFPPASRMAALIGAAPAVEHFLSLVDLPEVAEVFGPSDAGADRQRALVRVPRAQGPDLAAALKAAAAVRSARKSDGAVQIHLDPSDLG